jgi:hAT family C-terminal dimerisation region
LLQILNTAGKIKTGQYIASVCKQLITDIQAHCPATGIAGFVMDSASANRSAMDQLHEDGTLAPMVNLQCAAHTLSLLIKDLNKHFPWVKEVFRKVLFISNSVHSSEKLRFLFQQQCEKDNAAYSTIPSHCDTRFGSQFIVADAVDRRLKTLVSWAGSVEFLELVSSEMETAVELHTILLGQYGHREGLVKHLPILKELVAPVMKCLTQVEGDKASLSRMRALIRQLEAHAQWFTETYPHLCAGVIKKKYKPDRVVTLIETFHSRLRLFYYKPAMTAAFLLDPINFRVSDAGEIELPFEVLSPAEEDEAAAEIERLAGHESENVGTELANLKLYGIRVGPPDGLSNLNLKLVKQCMLVTEKDNPDGTVMRSSATPEIRLNCWLKVLGVQFPVLAKVAAVCLTMHSTSCASERNLSVFSRLFDKYRGSLQLKRGEKIVYLSVNDRIQTGMLDTSKEEVMFNDSDIEENIEDRDVEVVEQVGCMEAMLAGSVQDDHEATG